MGRSGGSARPTPRARSGRGPPTNRDRARPQEPTRSPGPPGGGRLPIPLSGLATGRPTPVRRVADATQRHVMPALTHRISQSLERQTTVIKDRLDPARVAIGTGVAGGLGVGLAAAFLRHAQQGTAHVGPTSATLDEAFSALFGAAVGVAPGSALCALSIRRGSPLLSGLLAGLAAYVLVLAPALMYTDDVSLAEDLSPGGLGFLAFLLLHTSYFLTFRVIRIGTKSLFGNRRRRGHQWISRYNYKNNNNTFVIVTINKISI